MADNIIINEFLTFVQNKIDILDELSILQICASNYSDADIENGKTVLCNACPLEGVRNIQRKGEDRKKKNIKDVIKIFKEVDPATQPIFVARDLNRLPPVSFDHVDVTRLLKDISSMKTELQALRNDYVTKSELMQFENKIGHQITNLPNLSVFDSSFTPMYRDVLLCSQADTQVKSDFETMSIKNDNENGFTTVTRNKSGKLRNMRGTAKKNTPLLQVVEATTYNYVSRLKKDVSVENIVDNIKSMGEECLQLKSLKQFKETTFNSFKLKILSSRLKTFLCSEFWPKGVVFRRYKNI